MIKESKPVGGCATSHDGGPKICPEKSRKFLSRIADLRASILTQKQEFFPLESDIRCLIRGNEYVQETAKING
jgi:hypothetical protein